MNVLHTFHIPVMGTGFTIDSPIRVARYGISSVISLVDDTLIENVRKFYAERYSEEYSPVNKHEPDWRARRITAYLDLVNRIVTRQFEELRSSPFEPGSEITKYFEFLPDTTALKNLYMNMLAESQFSQKLKLQNELRETIRPGSIDVNIMTKIDRANYAKDGTPLSEEHSDALAALRGYAQSTLKSAIVLSAGFNRRLYTYIEEFADFYPDENGSFRKEIILKVSDFRSALTQGKFLAKKGLWVSEFRIESGLNCGGHAFSGSGNLMGPILEEFKQKKDELTNTLGQMLLEALRSKGKPVISAPLNFRLTAQGGIGTFNEDKFLKRYYNVFSTGWGSPFLLVPEAVQIDSDTLGKLAAAGENDIFLSDVSPLNVAFNNLRNSLSEIKKCNLINVGTPGSPCMLGHLANNTEFTKNPVCTASRVYQTLKLEALKALGLPKEEYEKQARQITSKACICAQLGHGVYMNANIPRKDELAPAVCPGPNIAYFSRAASLKEMIDHIYGRTDIMPFKNRPHMFIKELMLNIEQFSRKVDEKKSDKLAAGKNQELVEYQRNLSDGIAYYQLLIPQMTEETASIQKHLQTQLKEAEEKLLAIVRSAPGLFS